MDSNNINFEDHFNKENISMDKIEFARHYVENHIGAEIDEDQIIEIAPIGSLVFGCQVAHNVAEFEKYEKCMLGGFKFSPTGEE